jgi:hypothetical protein
VPTLVESVSEWFRGLFGGKQTASASGNRAAGGRAAASRTSRRRSGSSEDVASFVTSLRDVVPDFDRYARAAGDDAAAGALRDVYAALPQTGKPSRASVARHFLVSRARAAGSDEDATLLTRLSERQVVHVARRAGIPI